MTVSCVCGDEFCTYNVCESTPKCDDDNECTDDTCIVGPEPCDPSGTCEHEDNCPTVNEDCSKQCCVDKVCYNEDKGQPCAVTGPSDTTGYPGSTVIVDATILNLGGCAGTYDLSAEQDAGPATLESVSVPSSIEVSPLNFANFQVSVTIAPDSPPGEATIELSASSEEEHCPPIGGTTCTITLTVTVIAPDLNLAGLPDEDEEDPGGALCLNADPPYPALTIDVPGATSGTGEFQVVSGDHLIQMYKDAAGTIPVMYFNQSWPVADLPVTRYVRGVDVSSALRDVKLRLTYEGPDGPCEDTLNLTVYKAEFVDQVPDYSLDINDDSDNFFLRQGDDFLNLDVFYRILPSGLPVNDVAINVYAELNTEPLAVLTGEQDGDEFKSGDNLHVQWADVRDEDDNFHDAGYYRVELVTDVDGVAEPCKTPIADAEPGTPGWQCPQNGLGIHDLIWKHRLIVNVCETEKGIPSNTAEFMAQSGGHIKEWTGGATPFVHPAGFDPGSINSFWDLFDDNEITGGDWDDYTPAQQAVLTTDPDAETVYHSANTIDANNFVFLQYWMFENFSMTPYGIPGYNPPPVWHEGDVEHVQIAIRLADLESIDDKATWVVPFGATASQHYYAQTLRWDVNDDDPPEAAHSQDHVEHEKERLVVFVALGAHATYFAADQDIEVPDYGGVLGIQDQYDPVPDFAYDTTCRTTGDAGITYVLLPVSHSDISLDTFEGRWGYLLSDDPDDTQNGPSGPPHRAALDEDHNPVSLRDSPRTLHNAARKTSQLAEMFIP